MANQPRTTTKGPAVMLSVPPMPKPKLSIRNDARVSRFKCSVCIMPSATANSDTDTARSKPNLIIACRRNTSNESSKKERQSPPPKKRRLQDNFSCLVRRSRLDPVAPKIFNFIFIFFSVREGFCFFFFSSLFFFLFRLDRPLSLRASVCA